MTFTVTLTPEREMRLQEQARMAGLPLEEYALRVLDGSPVAHPPLTPEQKAAAFLQWSQAQNPGVSPLPVEATTREALYAADIEPGTDRAA